jgi:serpin B
MKVKLGSLPIIVVVILSLFCSSSFAEKNGDLQKVVADNSAFAFDLYQKLRGNRGNLFFSPYSISTALAMTYAGARGQTEKEMAQVLHFSLDQDPLHSSFSQLQSHLNTIQNKGHIKLSTANSLWCQRDYHLLHSFLNLNRKHYGAGLNFVDFAGKTETSRTAINTWVENETQQKIKELIKPGVISSLTRLVLCNAIYFKGHWFRQFEEARTKEQDFYVTPQKIVEVPMMSQEENFRLKDFDKFSAIELPYEGNDLSMIIFLPKEIGGLAEFERNLTYDSARAWIDELIGSYKSRVLVSVPRFKVICELGLSKILFDMGMYSAFTIAKADFSGMTGNKELFIDKVVHKAFVEVNEEGTEAAAATSVIVGLTSTPPPPPTFRADHPFVFLIRDTQTGSILFVGRVSDPTKTGK